MTTSIRENEFEFIQGLTADLSAAELVFPTSMKAALNIKYAISQGNVSNERLANIICTEPVLFAQVLKISNSSEFNPPKKMTTDPRVVVERLGLAEVRKIATSVGMKQLSEYKTLDDEISKLMDGIWIRTLRVGVLSQAIAEKLTKVSPTNAMVAGILHDVGKFYILNRAKQYRALFTSLPTLWNMVDAWHANIGAAILENWMVADEIRQAVQNFSDSNYVHRGAANLTDVLIAANLLDAHLEEIENRSINWTEPPPALQHMKLTESHCEEFRKTSQVALDALLSSVNQ